MNIRASYRYQMADHKKSIIIFYICIVLIFAFIFASIGISMHKNDISLSEGTFSGMDISSAIFLFVVAMASYKETFGMMIQNGISRKTMFASRILSTVSIALVMAVIDKVLLVISKGVASNISDNLSYVSIYELLYSARVMEVSTVRMHVESFFFSFFMYLAFMAVGYLITTIFYRLNKPGKVLLASGLPVGVFVVLPILDSIVANGRISKALIELFDIAFGLTKQIPFNAMISCTLVFIIFSAVSWLFLRKANMKE